MLTLLMCIMWGSVGLCYGLTVADARGRRGFVSLTGVILSIGLTVWAMVVTWEIVR